MKVVVENYIGTRVFFHIEIWKYSIKIVLNGDHAPCKVSKLTETVESNTSSGS